MECSGSNTSSNSYTFFRIRSASNSSDSPAGLMLSGNTTQSKTTRYIDISMLRGDYTIDITAAPADYYTGKVIELEIFNIYLTNLLNGIKNY